MTISCWCWHCQPRPSPRTSRTELWAQWIPSWLIYKDRELSARLNWGCKPLGRCLHSTVLGKLKFVTVGSPKRLHVTPLSFLWASAPWFSSGSGMAIPTRQGFQAVPMPLRRTAPMRRNVTHKAVLTHSGGSCMAELCPTRTSSGSIPSTHKKKRRKRGGARFSQQNLGWPWWKWFQECRVRIGKRKKMLEEAAFFEMGKLTGWFEQQDSENILWRHRLRTPYGKARTGEDA